jgi:NADPH-dependent 7-cyano-7-deazaguanine reductase QueF
LIAPKVLPVTFSGVVLQECHTLALPPCCPISKNPRDGSTISISYEPVNSVLEVASLFAYIHQFVGGLRDEAGELVIRDMEGMIVRIAQDCSQVLGVPVEVQTNLVVLPKQEMKLRVRV